MTTMGSDVRCIHCNAELAQRDIAEGWCDSCGKRLPSSVAPRAKGSQPAQKTEAAVGAPSKGGRRGAIVCAALVILAGLATAIVLANVG